MRKARVKSKNGMYHCMIRGVNRQNIFYSDEDRQYYLNLIKKYGEKYEMECHVYALLDNHVHMLYKDLKGNISRFMQVVCSVYARYFNRKYDRIGHLFQDRFASEPVDDEMYYKIVARYILQNPMKAGLCRSTAYKWNSYRYIFSENHSVKTNFLKSLFTSSKELVRFLNENMNDSCLELEKKYSERKKEQLTRILKLLDSDSPVIDPELPRNIIVSKLRILKENGIPERAISRITGIGRFLVQTA